MCIRDRKKTVRKQWLEDLVVNQTMQLVKDDAAMESIICLLYTSLMNGIGIGKLVGIQAVS